MKERMDAILVEVRLLREDLQKDIQILEADLRDHEIRLRKLESRG